MSSDYAVALAAVAEKVSAAGYDPTNFKARILCDDDSCKVDVYPEELETKEYAGYMGCPLKLCATMLYSKSSQSIVETTHWR